MLTAFQEKGYERRDGLCLCEKQSQFVPGGWRGQPTIHNGGGPVVLNKANSGAGGPTIADWGLRTAD